METRLKNPYMNYCTRPTSECYACECDGCQYVGKPKRIKAMFWFFKKKMKL